MCERDFAFDDDLYGKWKDKRKETETDVWLEVVEVRTNGNERVGEWEGESVSERECERARK